MPSGTWGGPSRPVPGARPPAEKPAPGDAVGVTGVPVTPTAPPAATGSPRRPTAGPRGRSSAAGCGWWAGWRHRCAGAAGVVQSADMHACGVAEPEGRDECDAHARAGQVDRDLVVIAAAAHPGPETLCRARPLQNRFAGVAAVRTDPALPSRAASRTAACRPRRCRRGRTTSCGSSKNISTSTVACRHQGSSGCSKTTAASSRPASRSGTSSCGCPRISSSSTWGRFAENADRARGSSSRPEEAKKPSRRTPASPSECARRSSRATAIRSATACACSASRTPAAVSRRLCGCRSTNATPSSCSSRASWCEIAEGLRCSAWAAATMVPVRAISSRTSSRALFSIGSG